MDLDPSTGLALSGFFVESVCGIVLWNLGTFVQYPSAQLSSGHVAGRAR